MKHLKKEYNERIQDNKNLIPKAEPVFLIRAHDTSGPDAVKHWADLHETNGGDPKIAVAARKHALEMVAWQEKHGHKLAD